ncbi:MAG: LacI family DNA-binding transcriptional regulator [Desulfobacterales bacterium]|nr:LacI family DNA-binding transcriptional regulator [Desulfobacterales bacterium]
MKRKGPTLRDIARLAGVSHTTVSRVLNKDHRVRSETAEKVRAVVDAHKYRLDPLARRFARGQSNLIGLMVSDVKNPFYAEMARSIEDQARKMGYLLTICSTDGEAEVLEWYIDAVINAGIDGLIFASVHLVEPVVETLIRDRFPLVMINRRLKADRGDSVVLDNRKGAYLLTRHLIENGYRKIALINGPADVSTAVERLQGYRQALRESGIRVKQRYVRHVNFSRCDGFDTAMTMLQGTDRPDAIFGGNDYLAMGIMDAAAQWNLSVPEDLAVVGFDSTELAQSMELTTVSQHLHQMGSLAVQSLIQSIEQKPRQEPFRVVLEPKLVIRKSSCS